MFWLEYVDWNILSEIFDWNVLIEIFWMKYFDWNILVEMFWLKCFDWDILNEMFWLRCFDWCAVVIRIDLCGIAVVCWNSFDDKDISVHDPDDVKGDLNKEQYFEKIVLLQKGE